MATPEETHTSCQVHLVLTVKQPLLVSNLPDTSAWNTSNSLAVKGQMWIAKPFLEFSGPRYLLTAYSCTSSGFFTTSPICWKATGLCTDFPSLNTQVPSLLPRLTTTALWVLFSTPKSSFFCSGTLSLNFTCSLFLGLTLSPDGAGAPSCPFSSANVSYPSKCVGC